MDKRVVATILFAVLLSISGCSAFGGGSDVTPTPSPTSTPAPTTDTTTPTATATAIPTATATATPEPVDSDNPFRTRELQVYVEQRAGSDQPFNQQVDEALAYWEANAEQYAGYPVTFNRTSNIEEAHFSIYLMDEVETLEGCGDDDGTNTIGCGQRPGLAIMNLTVAVEAGYQHEDTVHILKHELGHSLGLDHGDDPVDLMQAKYDVYPISREFTYDIQTAAIYHKGSVNNQVAGGLSFLEKGGNGTVKSKVTFERDRDADVDILVKVTGESNTCGSNNQLCWEVRDDGTVVARVGDVEEDGVGWAVAWSVYGLLRYEGYAQSDRPCELQFETCVDPTKSWWR